MYRHQMEPADPSRSFILGRGRWEVAHALAAEVGDKLTALDRTHFTNLLKARELTKTKHQRHDRDPRTKQ